MNALGIYTGRDLRSQSLVFLREQFGKAGAYYYGVARGQDDRPVEADRVRKSIGAEVTFERDIRDWEEATLAVESLAAKVWATCTRGNYRGRTVTIKIKYADFHQITRSRSCATLVSSLAELESFARELLRAHFPARLGVRLLGVTISNLDLAERSERGQLALTIQQPALKAS